MSVADHWKVNATGVLHSMSRGGRRVIVKLTGIQKHGFGGATVVYPELILAPVPGRMRGDVGGQPLT